MDGTLNQLIEIRGKITSHVDTLAEDIYRDIIRRYFDGAGKNMVVNGNISIQGKMEHNARVAIRVAAIFREAQDEFAKANAKGG